MPRTLSLHVFTAALRAERRVVVPILAQAETTGNREFYDWIKALKDLLPILPPRMAETTTRVLKTGAGPFRRVPIWIGRDERDPKHQFGLWRPAEAPNESVDAA